MFLNHDSSNGSIPLGVWNGVFRLGLPYQKSVFFLFNVTVVRKSSSAM